jgi:hypothetical protein
VDGRDQRLGAGALDQEARSSGTQRSEHVVVLLEGGEDQNSRGRHVARQLAGRGDPVEVGHADVHEHDVGAEPPGSLDGLAPGGRLTDDLDRRIAREELDEPGPHEIVIVGDEHPCHVCGPRYGRRART